MPPFTWSANAYGKAGANLATAASGHLLFAIHAMETLHYLNDLDRSDERRRWLDVGYNSDVIDVAHARWAASTAITALDNCAAALAIHHNFKTKDGTAAGVKHLSSGAGRRALCPSCAKWVHGVITDPRYGPLRGARNPLVHSAVGRHISLVIGGHPVDADRLGLKFDDGQGGIIQRSSREIVELAVETTTEHVSEFVNAAIAGQF